MSSSLDGNSVDSGPSDDMSQDSDYSEVLDVDTSSPRCHTNPDDQHLYVYVFGDGRVDVVHHRRMYRHEETKWDRSNPTTGIARSLFSVRSFAQREASPISELSVPNTESSDQISYKCRHCQDRCINDADSKPAKARSCWPCFRLPALEDHEDRLNSGVGLKPAKRIDFDPLEEYEFVRRHATRPPHRISVIAQLLRHQNTSHLPTTPPRRPMVDDWLDDSPKKPPQDREPAAAPLTWGADPEARSQGPTEGTAPTRGGAGRSASLSANRAPNE